MVTESKFLRSYPVWRVPVIVFWDLFIFIGAPYGIFFDGLVNVWMCVWWLLDICTPWLESLGS